MKPRSYALTLAALLAPIPIGGIFLLLGVSYGAGTPTTQDLPDWYYGILVWSLVTVAFSDRLALNAEAEATRRVIVSPLLHRILTVYALLWVTALALFLLHYYRVVGGFWGLLSWEKGTRYRYRIDWLPWGIVPFYLYTFLIGVAASLRGLDRLRTMEKRAD